MVSALTKPSESALSTHTAAPKSLAASLIQENIDNAQGGGGDFDVSWIAHRSAKISEGYFKIIKPLKLEKEADDNAPKELHEFPVVAHLNKATGQYVNPKFTAIAGFILGYGTGFSMFDGVQKKMLCKAFKTELDRDGEVITNTSDAPLPFTGLRAPFKGKNSSTEYSWQLAKYEGLEIYGRATKEGVETLGLTEPVRTCRECVTNGYASRTIIEDEATGKSYSVSCGAKPEVTILVTHVGWPSANEKDMSQVELTWAKVTEVDASETISGPFPLVIKLSATDAVNQFGTGQYDHKVVLGGKSSTATPEDTTSLPQFVKQFNQSEQIEVGTHFLEGFDQPVDYFAPIPVTLHVVELAEASKTALKSYTLGLRVNRETLNAETLLDDGAFYADYHENYEYLTEYGHTQYLLEKAVARGDAELTDSITLDEKPPFEVDASETETEAEVVAVAAAEEDPKIVKSRTFFKKAKELASK